MSEQTEKAQFTPGPWVRDGTIIGEHADVIDLRLDDKGINWITVKGDDGATVEANARLISAAPKMYAALKALAEEASDSVELSDWPELQEALANADAALAKADGRE